MNIFIGSFFWDDAKKLSWASDETNHISAARSFLEGKNFDLNYFASVNLTLDEIIENDQNFMGPYKRPVLYHTFLGSFFNIFDLQNTEQVFYSSIFNNILGSIFLVVFFIVMKKFFNFQTAIFASLIIMTSNYTLWYTIRPLPIGLFFIFATASLYFLKKKNFHFFMFGILIGLAHMGAVPALMLGTSYIIILLAQKKLKGATIVFLTWNAILIPIYIRNFFIHKDIGVGLYIPFSNKISQLFSFLPSSTNEFNSSNVLNIQSTSTESYTIFFSQIFENLQIFHSTYLFPSILITGIILLDIYYLKSTNKALIFKNLKSFFKKIPDIYYLIILFASLNFFSAYFLFVNYGFYAGNKHMIFSSFLIMSLSLFGLGKIIDKISNYKISNLKLSTLIIIILISLPISDSIYGLSTFQDPPKMRLYTNAQLNSANLMYDWIGKNIPNDATISSNNSGDVKLKTNLTTITIPNDLSCSNMDNYLNHFNIDYVFWYPRSITFSDQESIFPTITHSKYRFENIFEQGDSVIYEIKPRIISLDSLRDSMKIIDKFESEGDPDSQIDRLDQFYSKLNPHSEFVPFLCDTQENLLDFYAFYDSSMRKNIEIYSEQNNFAGVESSSDKLLLFYENIILSNNAQYFSINSYVEQYLELSLNMINYYDEQEDFESVIYSNNKLLRFYDDVIFVKFAKELDYDSYISTNLEIHESLFHSYLDQNDISKAIMESEKLLDFHENLLISSQYEYFNLFEDTDYLNLLKNTVILNDKIENIDGVISNYDRLVDFYDLSKSNALSDWNVMTIYLDILFEAADFYNENSFETRELKVHDKILEIDRTNVKAWLGKAKLFEDEGSYSQAKNAYENALRFDSEYTEEIQQKLNELQ